MSRPPRIQIDADLAAQLDRLALKTRASRSTVVALALRDYLERDGHRQLDQMFQGRLDRMSLQLGRVERDCLVLIETLALLTRYLLTLNALDPDFDAPRRAAGQDRFEAFIDEVARQLMRGKSHLAPLKTQGSDGHEP